MDDQVPVTDLIEAVAENKATEVKEELQEEIEETVAEAQAETVIVAAAISEDVEQRSLIRDDELWNRTNQLESRITDLEQSHSKSQTLTETVTEPIAEVEREVEGVQEVPVTEPRTDVETRKKGWSLF